MTDGIEPRVERVARAIATAFCGGVDPDALVFTSWPALPSIRGAFFMAPNGREKPLWTWFEDAARAAIRVADETEGEGA